MWPFCALAIYVFLIVAFCKPRISDRRNWKYTILIVPIFLFAALRGNDDGDYFIYLGRGELIKSLDDVWHATYTQMEIGFRFIAYVVRKLELPRQFIVIFMNILSLSTVTYFIKKFSKDWCISTLLFIALFFQFDMHASRAAVSIGFCALGYTFIQKRQFFKYLLCIAIGSMFHITAITAIPLYFFYGKNITLKKGIIILGVEMLVIRFIDIYTILDKILVLLHLNFFSKAINVYVTSQAFGYPLRLYDPRIWIAIIVFFMAKTAIRDKDVNERFMCNAVFLYAFILILFSNTTFLAYRLSAFYYMYLIALVPSIVVKYNRYKTDIELSKYRRIQVFYICCIFFTLLNIAYATNRNFEYLSVFETKIGLLKY